VTISTRDLDEGRFIVIIVVNLLLSQFALFNHYYIFISFCHYRQHNSIILSHKTSTNQE